MADPSSAPRYSLQKYITELLFVKHFSSKKYFLCNSLRYRSMCFLLRKVVATSGSVVDCASMTTYEFAARRIATPGAQWTACPSSPPLRGVRRTADSRPGRADHFRPRLARLSVTETTYGCQSRGDRPASPISLVEMGTCWPLGHSDSDICLILASIRI